jgi:predicted transcriptional regulator
MKITKSRLKEIIKDVLKEESEYQKFFKKALEKAGKSIPQMSDDEKKAFFNKIEKTWRKKAKMTKNELYDIINEEIRDFKYGVNHFLVTEELNESDRDEIRKIIRQEVSAIFFDLFKKRKTWGA